MKVRITTLSVGFGATNGDPSGRSVISLADVGEDAAIAAIVARYPAPPAWLRVAPGDDAAVLDIAGQTVISTDTSVQDADFRLDWSAPAQVGIKVAAANFADVAAMGAVPLGLVISLAAPRSLPLDWAVGLADGFAQEAARAGAAILGGDLAEAGVVVITATALGQMEGPPVLRSGAQVGDMVAWTGQPGLSGAGLHLLLQGHGPAIDAGSLPSDLSDAALSGADLTGPDVVVAAQRALAAHRAPSPPYAAGAVAAAAGAASMIDTSDGLVRDLTRIAVASGVSIRLDPAAVAPRRELELLGQACEVPALNWVMAGGEDHELVATFPAGTVLPPEFTPIGVVCEPREGGRVWLGDAPWTGPVGWEHY